MTTDHRNRVQAAAGHHYDRIAEAHLQRGTRHAIRDIRVILESVFRMLTSAERRSFSNLYGRMEFVFDRDAVSADVREQLRSLRRLSNNIAHEHRDPTETEYLLCLKTVCMAVHHFMGAAVPGELQAAYASLGDRRFTRPHATNREMVSVLRPFILSVGPVESTGEGTRYFRLSCREEELGDMELQVWDTEGNRLTRLQPLLRPYMTARVTNCRQSGQRTDHYSTTASSQFVLEPDLLVDISDLAECFNRQGAEPAVALLRKLVPQEPSAAAFKGNMVNVLLDEVIRNNSNDFRTAFRIAVAENLLQSAAMGREALNEIYQSIKSDHWQNVTAAADTVRGKPVRIEPTFLSDRYGLQGRLDLLVEDGEDPSRKDIYELKSGKPPDFGTWVNNQMQVVGYNMLLRSCFGEGRVGSSAIIYSAAKSDPLRDLSHSLLLENRFLMARNIHVAHILLLAAGETDLLDRLVPEDSSGLPSFVMQDFSRFEKAYRTADPFARAYYRAFLSFTLREYLNAKCGLYSTPRREDEGDGFAALWLHEEDEKARHFNILRALRLTGFDKGENRVSFATDPRQYHNFRVGDTVILYPRRNGLLAPLEQQIVKARIDVIADGRVGVSLNNRQMDASYFEGFEDWVLEHDLYEGTHWQATRGLFRVLDAAHAAGFRSLNGQSVPECQPGKEVDASDLNENQRMLIRESMEASDYYLVQGPPGTGKTSTFLTRLTRALLEDSGSIVIVAFTNRAVDEIGLRLTDAGIDHLRMGSRQSESETALRKLVEGGAIEEATGIIRGHRVFIATVATMHSRLDALQRLKDDMHTLIVDEASQLTEPSIIGLLLAFRKCILVGDQNQLPPVVTQDPVFCTTDDPLLSDVGLGKLSGSLFERMMRLAQHRGWTHAYGMLTTHFRMHEEIAGLINPWYGNRLRCGREEQRRALPSVEPNASTWDAVLHHGRAVFIPSPREMTSKYHQTEAERVVSLLKHLRDLYGGTIKREQVGVVTPWRTQIGLIRSLLGGEPGLQDVNIDTVERFQGSENDIIIVSMSIYHPAQLDWLSTPGVFRFKDDTGEDSSVSLDRKLLVTVSRAKQQVILLGDRSALFADTHYAEVLGKMSRFDLA